MMLDALDITLFQEPENFRPPSPQPTHHVFQRDSEWVLAGTPRHLQFTLIGSHSLWAHMAWNAGILLATEIDRCKSLVKGKRVLELGCGAALPSMIAALNDASVVVATDYPETQIIQALERNVDANLGKYRDNVHCTGFLWGSDVTPLFESFPSGTEHKFDLIILCDLVFNHSQHHSLLKTCCECLAEEGSIYCVFSHHRPKWADRDMKFFSIAREEYNMEVMELDSVTMDPMFEHDFGDVVMRSTVKTFILRLNK